MAEMSKTARAAQSAVERGQQASKKKEVRTFEDAIRDIRSNRAAKLFHSNMNDIDMLLAEYDKTLKTLKDKQVILDSFVIGTASDQQRLSANSERIAELEAQVAAFKADAPTEAVPVTEPGIGGPSLV